MYYKKYIVYLSFKGFVRDLRDDSFSVSSNLTTVYRIWLCLIVHFLSQMLVHKLQTFTAILKTIKNWTKEWHFGKRFINNNTNNNIVMKNLTKLTVF